MPGRWPFGRAQAEAQGLETPVNTTRPSLSRDATRSLAMAFVLIFFITCSFNGGV